MEGGIPQTFHLRRRTCSQRCQQVAIMSLLLYFLSCSSLPSSGSLYTIFDPLKLFERQTSELPVLLKKPPNGLAGPALKRPKTRHYSYSPEDRAFGKYSAEHRPAKAVRHFSSCVYYQYYNSNKQLLCMTANIKSANCMSFLLRTVITAKISGYIRNVNIQKVVPARPEQ